MIMKFKDKLLKEYRESKEKAWKWWSACSYLIRNEDHMNPHRFDIINENKHRTYGVYIYLEYLIEKLESEHRKKLHSI